MQDIADKICRKLNHIYQVQKNCVRINVVYAIMWKNMVEPDRSRMTRMVHAHCMLDNYGYKHTVRISNTFYFPLRQWLHKHASILVVCILHVLYIVELFVQHVLLSLVVRQFISEL